MFTVELPVRYAVPLHSTCIFKFNIESLFCKLNKLIRQISSPIFTFYFVFCLFGQVNDDTEEDGEGAEDGPAQPRLLPGTSMYG